MTMTASSSAPESMVIPAHDEPNPGLAVSSHSPKQEEHRDVQTKSKEKQPEVFATVNDGVRSNQPSVTSTLMPRNGPPPPSVIEATGRIWKSGKILRAKLSNIAVLPELRLSVLYDVRIHEDGTIEITNESIVSEIRKRYLYEAHKREPVSRRVFRKLWPRMQSALTYRKKCSGTKCAGLRRAVERVHSKKRPYTRPSLDPVETQTPLSKGSLIQLPEAIVNVKDLRWVEVGTTSLIIEGFAAKRFIASSILWLPDNHKILRKPEEWVLHASNKETGAFKGYRDITLSHIRSGRWLWVIQTVGPPKIDIEFTEALEVARAMPQDGSYLGRACKGMLHRERPMRYYWKTKTVVWYKHKVFLEVLLYDAKLAAGEEINLYKLNRPSNDYRHNIDIFNNVEVIRDFLAQSLGRKLATPQPTIRRYNTKSPLGKGMVISKKKRGKEVAQDEREEVKKFPSLDIFTTKNYDHPALPTAQDIEDAFYENRLQSPAQHRIRKCNLCDGSYASSSRHSQGCDLSHFDRVDSHLDRVNSQLDGENSHLDRVNSQSTQWSNPPSPLTDTEPGKQPSFSSDITQDSTPLEEKSSKLPAMASSVLRWDRVLRRAKSD